MQFKLPGKDPLETVPLIGSMRDPRRWNPMPVGSNPNQVAPVLCCPASRPARSLNKAARLSRSLFHQSLEVCPPATSRMFQRRQSLCPCSRRHQGCLAPRGFLPVPALILSPGIVQRRCAVSFVVPVKNRYHGMVAHDSCPKMMDCSKSFCFFQNC